MKVIEVRRMIAAPPQAVWDVLTNPVAIVASNMGVMRLTGHIVAGQTITLESATAPGRLFKLKVDSADAPRQIVWSSGAPVIFNGRRTFTLTPQPGGCEFHMIEVYKGLMLPLIWRSMPDMQPGFDQFGDGLKRIVELGQ